MSIVSTLARSRVVDRERLLAKLDELDGYLRELRAIAPPRLENYRTIEKKRACERLLTSLGRGGDRRVRVAR